MDYIQVLCDHVDPYYDHESMVGDYCMSCQKKGEDTLLLLY